MTLRELIQHRQTTGAALGRALGWSRATVSDYVTGRRRPKLETAARIAGALNAVVIVNPPHKGANWNYTPVEDSPARRTTQEEANDEMSYLDDAE